jgi:ketosteroid isomerase-like protein
MAARDADALPALFSDEVEVVDHPTGSTYGREGVLGTYHAVLRAQDPVFRTEPLATLGESLVLHHWSISASGVAGGKFDVGAYENDGILLIEVDTQGRARRREAFAPDHLGDAVLRLYERYPETLPDGPARTRAAVIARFLAWLGRDFELDRAAQAVAPSVEYVDHRRIIGVGSLHGAEAFLQMMRTERELSASALHRMDDVLALRSDALLGRFTTFGTDRGGGPHERSYLTLFAFGSAGRVTRLEEFDDDCVAEALARFDTLQADATEGPTTGSPVVRFENAATRYGARFREAWEARDWERVAAMPAPGLRVIDRRAMMRMDLDRDAYLASLRYVFDLRSSRFTERVLATRGDRLALARLRFEASDRDVGPSESEYLLVTVVADHGDAVALVAFDVADLEAAYAELDERYVAGEAASYARTWESSRSIVQAIDARDWEQLAAVFAPGFVLKDHRPLGLLNSLSRDEWVASVRALLDLRPDAHFRIHHVLALDDRRWLTIQAWEGDEAEGEFEIGAACVMSCGAEGIEQWQAYNLDQLDAAWAQFDALGMSGQADGGAGPGPAATHDALAALAKPNAATRAMVRVGGLMRARDWEGCRALTSTDFTYEDRCRHALVTGDVEVWIRSMQEVTSWPGIGLNRASIGTFGDRIEVIREMWKGEPNTGAFEIEFIRLVEVAADGRLVANVKFDVEDRRAALAEAHARFVAGEAAANGGQTLFLALARAFARHDWEAFRACLSPDAVICDRRTPAVLGTIGRDQWVTSLRALSELAPDVTVECMRILTWNDRGRVDVTRQFGTTRDGGPFETVVVRVLVTDGAHLRRNEVFDVADTEPALARFAELCGGDGAAP